jgi:hypothetical protein
MAKRGKPFTYQSEDEKPVTVSLRIPRDLYERMSRYAARHRQSVTELLLDGLKWRLEEGEPRSVSMGDMLYYNNTVLQELAKPAHARRELCSSARHRRHANTTPIIGFSGGNV